MDDQVGRLSRMNWWVLVILSIILCITGQACAIILGKFYYKNGGSSTWMINLVQTAGFPIVFIPYLLIARGESEGDRAPGPCVLVLSCIYLVTGILCCVYGQLYSFGMLYLPGSTFSIICASQLAFNAVFSFFINHQRFTILILNSVAILSLSSSLIGADSPDDSSSSSSRPAQYLIGTLSTLLASALYSLQLSLMELNFKKVLKKETVSVILEMQIGIAFVASCFSVSGLFASGEWRNVSAEMESFENGRIGYVMTLIWQVIAWQVAGVGMAGLVFLVSSLFSNVINTLSLALTPLASLVFLHEHMNGVLIIAMLMALWGSASYIYQKYIDDLNMVQAQAEAQPQEDDLNFVLLEPKPSLIFLSRDWHVFSISLFLHISLVNCH